MVDLQIFVRFLVRFHGLATQAAFMIVLLFFSHNAIIAEGCDTLGQFCQKDRKSFLMRSMSSIIASTISLMMFNIPPLYTISSICQPLQYPILEFCGIFLESS